MEERETRSKCAAIRSWISAVLTAALATTSLAAENPRPPDAPQPGESAKILLDPESVPRAGPFRRSFRLHLPRDWDEGAPRPLVVALHGGVARGAILERQTGFSDVADREGFLVAYPNGLGIFGLLRHWNGGYCCARAARIRLDDVGFLDAVIDWISERYAVAGERVFVVGYSNGGMLAYRYAAQRPERVAALGIWASSVAAFGTEDGGEPTWVQPVPGEPVPAFIAHGTADPRLPYDVPGTGGDAGLLGALGSARFWAHANGCAAAPKTGESRSGALAERTWCAEGAGPVKLLGVAGWKHEWPGPKRTGRRAAEDPLRDFHLAAEMWRFFEALP